MSPTIRWLISLVIAIFFDFSGSFFTVEDIRGHAQWLHDLVSTIEGHNSDIQTLYLISVMVDGGSARRTFKFGIA